MSDWPQLFSEALGAMSVAEGIAVMLAVAYLLLAAREHIACWACALASTAIYTAVFWDVSLLMESALNVYYMAMAVYGWQQWRYGGEAHEGVPIRTLSLRQHGLILAAVACLTLGSGTYLAEQTTAAWPYVDSFTTWASVITTVLVAKKYLENWLYWFVIDSVSIPLYLDRGLYLTAGLFAVYLVIIVFGYLSWQRQLSPRTAGTAHA
ncbi:MAG: nicotinamide riboside transporter PnuC [Gammaproteobacteria bacterium]